MRSLFALLIFAVAASAATTPRGVDMNYGPFLGYTVQATNETVCKGVTVALTAGTNRAAITFDTDTLRYAMAWTDGWLDLDKTHLTTEKGDRPPRVSGNVQWTNQIGPGWAKNGSLNDPRASGIGPMPRDWAHYGGLFRSESNVVFHYTVGSCDVLDQPGLVEADGALAFIRTFRIAASKEPLLLRVCSVEGPLTAQIKRGPFERNWSQTAVGALRIGVEDSSMSPRSVLKFTNGEALLEIPPATQPRLIRLALARAEDAADAAAAVRAMPLRDPQEFCAGGPALWPEVITTTGKPSTDSASFVVDTATLPEANPWRSWMRLTGLDFFSDGRAAVCTWNGDVWIASGLDASLREIKWKRFAAGLFDPLGLKIFRDDVYVLERGQITRLRDLNNDGEADAYENFNNESGVSPSYHAFAMDLQTDSAGNFYFCRAGQRVEPAYPLNGGMVRISADGARAELIAHGLRVANGMAVGPHDEIVCSDNQGNWIPSSRINLINPRQPQFWGYAPHAHGLPTNTFAPPLCWIPMSVDNSSGGEVFVTSDRWPQSLRGMLLHTSYGVGGLFAVLWETNSGVAQGGVVKLPLKFDSGIMRPRFNPADGNLYVAGLRGWQTKGGRDGALQRVRVTGVAPQMPNSLRVRKDGIEIGFTGELDRSWIEDTQNWSVEQWNYLWSEKYGSDDYSVANPAKKGHDRVEVRSAKLIDKQRVLLDIAPLQPVMQMKIKFAAKFATGDPVPWEIYNTINVVPK